MAANKVLIVDENSEMRTQLREMLPGGNFQILEAIDGEEAMLLFDIEREALRLVIFNFNLPAVSGWEILKKLQTDETLQKIAVVVMCDRVSQPQAIVPQSYFEYIEVLEIPSDRKSLQKALKSAVSKTKLPRNPLPTEPLTAPTSPVQPEPPSEDSDNLLSLDLESRATKEAAFEDVSPQAEPPLEELAAVSAPTPAETVSPAPELDNFSELNPASADSSNNSATAPPATEETPPFAAELGDAAVASTALDSEWVENGESVTSDTAEFALAPTPYEALDCYHIMSDRAAWGVSCLAISNDGQYLIGGSESNPIKIWNLTTGTLEVQWNLFSRGTSCLTLTLDGQIAIAGSEQTNLKLWDLYSGELLGPLNDHASGISTIALAPDGLTLVSGALRSNVKLWDLQTGNLIGPLNDQSFGTTAVAIAPDGQTLITGYEATNIKLWDFSTGELLGPLNIESSNVTSLTLSPDGQLVISGHRNGVIAIADLYSGRVLRRLKAHHKPVNAVCMTSDGQVLVSASDSEIKFWGAVG